MLFRRGGHRSAAYTGSLGVHVTCGGLCSLPCTPPLHSTPALHPCTPPLYSTPLMLTSHPCCCQGGPLTVRRPLQHNYNPCCPRVTSSTETMFITEVGASPSPCWLWLQLASWSSAICLLPETPIIGQSPEESALWGQ